MGNKISSKVIKINDMTISNSKIFEKELLIILSNEVYYVKKEFFEQLELRLRIEIQNKDCIRYGTSMSKFFTKLGYNMLNAKLSTILKNTVKATVLGYSGLYVYDKLRYPTTSININENDNIYKVGYNDCLDYVLDLTKREHMESINGLYYTASPLLTSEARNILKDNCTANTNNIRKKLTKDYTNPLLRMTLEGLGCGLAANIFYNIVNCDAIYNKNLLEMDKCLEIVQKYKDIKK